MSQNKIPQNVVEQLARKGLRIVSEAGTRFAVTDGSRYFIARLSKGGGKKGGYSARVGKTPYDELPALSETGDPLKVIGAFLEQDRSLVTSHLYGDSFAVAKVSPLRGWQYFTARLAGDKVEIDKAHVYPDRGAALAQVHRSGSVNRSLDLSSLPSRPLNLYT
jgi:hypothetical protein